MFVDDGSWASRLALKDKAQSTVQDLAGLIKAANVDADLPESLTETAKHFSTLDGTMRTTRQNMAKLSQVLRQVQEVNFHLLDNLRATNETTESLRIQPPLARVP